MSATLNREIIADAWGTTITLPKGTVLVRVKGGSGPSYAVASEALLIRLTGNTHDPHYRYLFVPDDAVERGQP